MTNDDLITKKQDLVEDLKRLEVRTENRRRSNRRWSSVVVILSLVAAGMAAVGGFFIVGAAGGGVDGPEAAALGGVSAAGGLLLAFARGLESAFKFQERADFYRVLRSEAANLIAATRYVVKTDNEFRTMVRKYQSLNSRTATAVPRGQGMQAIKLFYEDLDSQGIIEVPRELLSTE